MDKINREVGGFLAHVGLEAKDADCEHWSAHAGPVEIFLYNLQTGHRYLRDHWVLAVAVIFGIGGYLAGKLR